MHVSLGRLDRAQRGETRELREREKMVKGDGDNLHDGLQMAFMMARNRGD
jgi:hypothetical protein